MRKDRPFHRSSRDESRALTSVLQYVLVIFMVSLLVSGLLFGFSEIVLEQREQTVRSNLEAAGHRIAGGIATTDRLGTSESTATVTIDLSSEVVQSQYFVTIQTQGGDPTVVLKSWDPEVTVRVGLETETPVRETTVRGGPITIRYDQDDDVLEVVQDGG